MTGYRTRSPALERSILWLQHAFLRPPDEVLITYAWKATIRVVSLAAVSVSPRNASPVARRDKNGASRATTLRGTRVKVS